MRPDAADLDFILLTRRWGINLALPWGITWPSTVVKVSRRSLIVELFNVKRQIKTFLRGTRLEKWATTQNVS